MDNPGRGCRSRVDPGVVDEVVQVDADEAYPTARALLREEGVFVRPPAGASVAVAARLAARAEFAGATIVTVLPDTGEGYLSAGVFGEASS